MGALATADTAADIQNRQWPRGERYVTQRSEEGTQTRTAKYMLEGKGVDENGILVINESL